MRSFDRLRLEPGRSAPSLAATREVLRPPSGQLRWGPWSVRWRPDQAPEHQPRDGGIAWFIHGELALRPWRPGDRVAPIGGTGHRLAAKCFQEARVPASERGSWPLVEGAGKVAWIPGVCRSGDPLPERGAPAIRVEVDLHADPRAGGRDLRSVVFDATAIAARVRALGEEITRSYPDGDLLLIGLLNGSFIFLADLARAIERPLTVDFLVASSYGASTYV